MPHRILSSANVSAISEVLVCELTEPCGAEASFFQLMATEVDVRI